MGWESVYKRGGEFNRLIVAVAAGAGVVAVISTTLVKSFSSYLLFNLPSC